MTLKKILDPNATHSKHFIILLFCYYFSVHKFIVVCILETHLDSTTTLDDNNFEIAGYNLWRADHACNGKRGNNCAYYKSSFDLGLINAYYLQVCLIFEILVGGK